MKRKSALVLYAAIVSSIVLAGCKSKPLHYLPAFDNKAGEKKVFLFGVPSQSYYGLTDSIVKYLNGHLHGVRVQTVATSSYSKYNEQLAHGYYDLTIANGLSALEVSSKDYNIVAKVVDKTGNSASILVNTDSLINTFTDLKGKTVATPGPPALPGHILQMIYLDKHGLNPVSDLKFRYLESYESVFLNVYLGKCSIGFSNTMSWNAFIKKRPEIATRVVEKWQIPGTVGPAVLLRSDMDKALAAQLKELFLSMHTDDTGRMALGKIGFLRFDAADSNSYEPIKQVIKEYNSVITGKK